MSKQVTIRVDIDMFDTPTLMSELYERIGDHLYDPEPQHDSYLDAIDKAEKEDMLKALKTFFGVENGTPTSHRS